MRTKLALERVEKIIFGLGGLIGSVVVRKV